MSRLCCSINYETICCQHSQARVQLRLSEYRRPWGCPEAPGEKPAGCRAAHTEGPGAGSRGKGAQAVPGLAKQGMRRGQATSPVQNVCAAARLTLQREGTVS